MKRLTVKEVADLLGVHPNTVKRLPIPFTRIGKLRRYHPKAVERYERDHSNRPAEWDRATA